MTPVSKQYLERKAEFERTVDEQRRREKRKKEEQMRIEKTKRNRDEQDEDAKAAFGLLAKAAAEKKVRHSMGVVRFRQDVDNSLEGKLAIVQANYVARIRSKVLKILQQHDPTKVAKIDEYMTKFEGRESKLVEKMIAKYEGTGEDGTNKTSSLPRNAQTTKSCVTPDVESENGRTVDGDLSSDAGETQVHFGTIDEGHSQELTQLNTLQGQNFGGDEFEQAGSDVVSALTTPSEGDLQSSEKVAREEDMGEQNEGGASGDEGHASGNIISEEIELDFDDEAKAVTVQILKAYPDLKHTCDLFVESCKRVTKATSRNNSEAMNFALEILNACKAKDDPSLLHCFDLDPRSTARNKIYRSDIVTAMKKAVEHGLKDYKSNPYKFWEKVAGCGRELTARERGEPVQPKPRKVTQLVDRISDQARKWGYTLNRKESKEGLTGQEKKIMYHLNALQALTSRAEQDEDDSEED